MYLFSLWKVVQHDTMICLTSLSTYVFAYLHTTCSHRHDTSSAHSITLLHFYRTEGIIIVILCVLYCNVFSLVNGTCGYRRVLQSRVTVSLWFAGAHSCVLEAGKVGSYDFNVS